MKPIRLDEFPIHQTPLGMAQTASSDRNTYDRCYLNAFDTESATMMITGFGVYPNLAVRDAFVSVRRGDIQRTVRFSDALDERSTEQAVGPYRIEVVEPLRQLRLVCDHPDLSLDLAWQGTHPAILEQGHKLMQGERPIIDSSRFAQAGSWSGSIVVDGETLTVSPDTWFGTRDRSWGIRGVGEAEPAGRDDSPREGFWWMYCPLRFEEFTLVVIAQEGVDGYRTLNFAARVFPDGRIEQLGWPRFSVEYRSGTRIPTRATIALTTQDGSDITVEIEAGQFIPLHVGCGYGGDGEWNHGVWKGRDWSGSTRYDYSTEEIAGKVPWGVIDHVAKATCRTSAGTFHGHGLFEHASMGRHDPGGFTDWMSVAP